MTHPEFNFSVWVMSIPPTPNPALPGEGGEKIGKTDWWAAVPLPTSPFFHPLSL
jgi:hypothetical protein